MIITFDSMQSRDELDNKTHPLNRCLEAGKLLLKQREGGRHSVFGSRLVLELQYVHL